MAAGAPAVVIHGLEDGKRVLRQGAPVTILSAPGAALYAGAGWWRALIATLHERYPAAVFTDILDCADAPGRAAEALRAGQKLILFYPETAALLHAVVAMAAACDAAVLTERPDALDMAARGAERRLAAWLAADGVSG